MPPIKALEIAEYITRIDRITGVDHNDENAELDLNWTTLREARVLVARLGLMQQRLLALRDEMGGVLADHQILHPPGHTAAEKQLFAQSLEPFKTVQRTIGKQVELFDSIKDTIRKTPGFEPELALGDFPEPLTRFYILSDGQVKGPFVLDQLLDLRKAGTIDWETQCCAEGTEDWLALGDADLV